MAIPRIGVLFGGPQFLIDRQFWDGAVSEAAVAGASVVGLCGGMLGDPRGFAAADNHLFRLPPPDSFDALVAWTGEMAVYSSVEEIAGLLAGFAPLPVVCAATRIPGHPCVIGGNYTGMRKGVEHLVRVHGASRIAFIKGPRGHPEAEERFRAWTDALRSAGLAIDERLVLAGDFDEASGRDAIRELARRGPIDVDAVVAANDPSALGAMRELAALSLEVPRDVAVLGFDDREDAACSKPGLTTVRYSFRELGRLAVSTAVALARGENVPELAEIDMPLVARASCGCRTRQADDDTSWYRAISRMRRDHAGKPLGIPEEADDGPDDSGRVFHEALLRFEAERDQVSSVMEQAVVELEIAGLAEALVRHLPALGLSRFSLYLYDGPRADPTSALKLVAGYGPRGRSHEEGLSARPADLALAGDGSRRLEALAIPLCFREETLGLLVAELPAPAIRVCETLRGPLSRGLKTALLLDERERAKAEIARAYARVALINKLGSRMTSLLEVQTLLKSASELVRDEFGVTAVVVYLREDPDPDHPPDVKGLGSPLMPAFAAFADSAGRASISDLPEATHDHGPARAVRDASIETREGIGDLERAADRSLFSFARSRFCVPLEVSGRMVGALDLQSERDDFFSPDVTQVLVALATYVASAIRNASLYAFATHARREAEEANRMKSRFLSTVSHELRTPLNAVINFAYLLEVGSEGEMSQGQKELVTAIEGAGRHLLRLINNILDLAKIEVGRMELFVEETDLAAVIDEAMRVTEGLVAGKDVRLVRDVAPDFPKIRSDRTRVAQILLNLLSNAAKFTDKGEIAVIGRADEDGVTVAVRDTGPGMDSADLPRIFQEFGQLKEGASKQGSTGLGLPIARRLAELHGGSLEAETAPGEGSVFTLRLPYDASSPKA